MKRTTLGLLIVMITFVSGTLFAQGSSQCGSKRKDEVSSNEHHGETTDEHERVVIRQERVMSDIRALDTHLQALITKMNAAQGSEKTEAIADVVNELVRQQTGIHEQIVALQSEVMDHMGNHTGTGMSQGTHSGDCPMMQSTMENRGGESSTEGGAHKH